MNKKKTVGQLASEARAKKSGKLHVWEYVEARARDQFIPNLLECIERSKQLFPDKDFFISNLGKNEELLPEVKREYWVPLGYCPTPNFNQIVFRYIHKAEQLELIWSIPPEDGCEYLIRNKNLVVPEEHNLLEYVIAFTEGRLDQMCKFLNGEKPDQNIILQAFSNEELNGH